MLAWLRHWLAQGLAFNTCSAVGGDYRLVNEMRVAWVDKCRMATMTLTGIANGI